MLIDGIQLLDGSTATNFTIGTGATFPSPATIGELFYNTGANSGLYVYDGAEWVDTSNTSIDIGQLVGILPAANFPALTGDITTVAGNIATTLAASGVTPGTYTQVTVDAKGRVTLGASPTTLAGYGITDAAGLAAFNTHAADDTRHLTSAENTLIDGITVSSTEINRLSGVTSNVQTQLNTLSSTQTTDEGNLATHIADATVHLTSAQNTWIDAVTVTAAEVNRLSGVTSNVQTQINTDVANLATHMADDTRHLTSAQNTLVDGITVSSTEINSLSGVTSNVQTQINNLSTSSSGNLATHAADQTLHLTPAENTWIDAITATSTEVNYLGGVTSGVQAQLGTKLNKAGDTMTGSLIMSTGTKVTIPDSPTVSTDAANKAYVDSVAAGLTWKNAVTVATTANITLSGTQTIDGVAVVAGNRVLVKNQTTASANGIYVVAAGAWSRSSDMDQTTPLNEFNGAGVWVEGGTTQGNTGWTVTNTITTIGTDPVNWSQFNGASGITPGVGLAKSGNTLSVQLGAGIAELPTNEVGIDIYATGGLMNTVDGTNASTADTAQLSLTKTGVGAGTYKSVTVDVYGRISAGTNPTTLAGYGITDAAGLTAFNTDVSNLATHIADASVHLTSTQNTWIDAITASSTEVNYSVGVTSAIQTQLNNKQPLDADLTAIGGIAATSGLLKKTAAGTWSLDTNTYLTGNQNISVTGDATGSGTTAIALTLAASGVTAGTYRSVTVDAKGRVTAGTNPTTVSGYGLTDATAINPATPKDGDVQVSAGPVIKIYAASAWRQIFPAVYA